MIKKYVGDRTFYKMTFTVALPMMLQNFISNFVNMLDNIMVGAVGTEQMSGVSIVNQLFFIFNLAIFGSMGGVGIFTAQFYGKKDNDGIRYTFRYKIYIALLIAATAFFAFTVFDDELINLFLHDDGSGADLMTVLSHAKDYLGIALIGLIPFALSQSFAGTLRETGDTFTPMLAGLVAVIINCVFNYLLIFGKLFFPVMGVRGAAAATVLSRYVECLIVIVYAVVKKKRFPYIHGLFRGFGIPKKLFADITKTGMPILINEIVWSTGMSTLTVAFSLHGLSVVAGYSISSTITNLFNIAFLSMGSAIGIIAGKHLGAGEYKEAEDTVNKLTAFSVAMSIVVGTALLLSCKAMTGLYKTSEDSKELALYFLKVCAFIMPFYAYTNAAYFTLRSGGKTLITFLFDSGTLWLIAVPTAFGLYYFAHMNIYIVFAAVQGVEAIRTVVGYLLVRKKIWLNTII